MGTCDCNLRSSCSNAEERQTHVRDAQLIMRTLATQWFHHIMENSQGLVVMRSPGFSEWLDRSKLHVKGGTFDLLKGLSLGVGRGCAEGGDWVWAAGAEGV